MTVRPRWPSSAPGAVLRSKPQPSSVTVSSSRSSSTAYCTVADRACACASALASASLMTRAASVTASRPASPWPFTRTGVRERRAADCTASRRLAGASDDSVLSRSRTSRCAASTASVSRARSGCSSASSRRATARYCASPSCTSAASVRRSRSIAAACSSRRSRAVVIPALSCVHSRLRTVPDSASSAIGAGAEAITTPSTSGRSIQSCAGGSNGFATSQPAGSRRMIGAPRRQPPGLLVEAQLVRGGVADGAAQHGFAVRVRGRGPRGRGRAPRASRPKRGGGQHSNT